MKPSTSAASGEAASILILIDGLEANTPGGTERQALWFASVLHEAGYQVVVYVLRGIPLTAGMTYPFEIVYGEIAKPFSPSGFAALWRLTRWMRARRFQMLQTFLLESNLLGPVLAKLAGVPAVLGHRRNVNHWMSRRFAFLQSLADRGVDGFLANSEQVKKSVVSVERVPAHKVTVLYNGIEHSRFSSAAGRQDVRRRLGFAEGDTVIGTVATLRPIKGLDDLIAAASDLAPKHPAMRVLLVGDGPHRGALETKARTAGLEQRIRFAGSQNDVPSFLAAMDIAVLPSLAEGFSNALLEYMAAGLPIVATDVGGNREALGETGLLVPPGQPEALAEAIARLVRDPELRRRLGAAAQDRVRSQFGIDAARQRFLEYVRSALETTAGS